MLFFPPARRRIIGNVEAAHDKNNKSPVDCCSSRPYTFFLSCRRSDALFLNQWRLCKSLGFFVAFGKLNRNRTREFPVISEILYCYHLTVLMVFPFHLFQSHQSESIILPFGPSWKPFASQLGSGGRGLLRSLLRSRAHHRRPAGPARLVLHLRSAVGRPASVPRLLRVRRLQPGATLHDLRRSVRSAMETRFHHGEYLGRLMHANK